MFFRGYEVRTDRGRSLIPARRLAAIALAVALLPLPSGAVGAPAPGPTEEAVAVPEPTRLALRYHETGNALWILDQAWALALPAVLLGTGLSARLRDLARRVGRRPVPTLAIFASLYLILTAALGLPLTYYQGFVRPHAYGLSDRPLAEWAMDGLKVFGVWLVIAVPVIVVIYKLMARFPRLWWLYAGLLTLPFLLFLALIKPVWIDPLTNRYGPLRDRALEARILALARRAGIEGGRVFEVDKSRQTKTVNAYVTGFLGTDRVVLWDTAVDQLDEDELMAVLGHELGHYVLGHVASGLALTSGLILVGLFAVDRLATWWLRRRPARFGFDRLADPASLPMVVILALLANLALTPIGFWYSRRMEHEADRFALEITRDNRAAASAFVKLQRRNLGVPRPGPFYMTFRATHPSLGERIDFCNAYRPWVDGAPLRYATLIRDRGAGREGGADRGGPEDARGEGQGMP